MLKDLIELIKDVSLRHKGVKTFRYQDDRINNAQNNHAYYQVYVDDVSLHQINITTNIFKAEFQVYILGFVDDEHDELDVQDNAYTIACDMLAYLDTKDEYKGVLSVYDYSILTISHYTDDSSAGVKLSVVLQLPNPVSMCELDENFNDEPYSGDTDTEITISGDTVSDDLVIKPIHLPKNRDC